MSAYRVMKLENGIEWAVGSFGFSPADIVIPVEALAGLSDEQISRYVKALIAPAVQLNIDEITETEYLFYGSTLEYSEKMKETYSVYWELSGLDAAASMISRINREIVSVRLRDSGSKAGVYLLGSENGVCKIGHSIHPHKRARIINNMSPVDVSLLHVITTKETEAAEEMLHNHFQDKRTSGEWFELTDSDIHYIKSITGFENGEFIYG